MHQAESHSRVLSTHALSRFGPYSAQPAPEAPIPYIWQHPDWPEFRWNPRTLLEPLAHLAEVRGRLLSEVDALRRIFPPRDLFTGIDNAVDSAFACDFICCR